MTITKFKIGDRVDMGDGLIGTIARVDEGMDPFYGNTVLYEIVLEGNLIMRDVAEQDMELAKTEAKFLQQQATLKKLNHKVKSLIASLT